MAFDEVLFPPDIAWGATGGPKFSTGVLTTTLGYEFRNREWSAALAEYDVSHATRTQAEMDILVAFYRARNGSVRGFRFKDWMDYKLEMDPSVSSTTVDLGAGDDSTGQTFQLQKSYGDAESTYIRVITKPVASTVVLTTDVWGTGTIIDSLEAAEDYSIDITTGIITWLNEDTDTIVSTADPGGGTLITLTAGSGKWPVGSSVYIEGTSGTAASTLNNKRHKVFSHTVANVIGIETPGVGLVSTGGTATSVPNANEIIRASDFQFDVPVRFSSDKMAVSIDSFENYSADKIDLREVRDPGISVAQTEPTTTFHDVRLDPKISFGATGAPRFKVNVFSTTGGHSARLTPWDEDRPEYDVAEGLKDFEDFKNILDFFYARYGKAYAFRFRDWQDYNMSGTEGGVDQTPDGIITLFNLVKKYTSGPNTFYRQITAPIEPSEEIVPAKYGSQQLAPDFVITVGGIDVDHDANDRWFAIDGRDVLDTFNVQTGISHGTFNFALTPRDGGGATADLLTITGITQANPAVVTVSHSMTQGQTAGHIEGTETGESLWLSGIVGMVELNDRRFKITKLTTTTFELDGENSTGHTAYGSVGIAEKQPQSGETVVVTGDFDVPVRFGTDAMAFTHENHGFHSWGGIPLEGVRLK